MIEAMEDAQATVLCCPRCDAVNQPQRKYCVQCGSPLWEKCFNCGETCAAGEQFCGACGANVGEVVARQIQQLEDDLRKAEEMGFACRFDEAIVLLSAVSKNKHPRMAGHAARAAKLIGLLSGERVRRRNEAESARQEAEKLFADFDYESAARVIEAVPPPLRGDQIKGLHAQIMQRQREIADLTRELSDAVKRKRLLDLPPKIERLLAIKPDHLQAKALAERLQKRLVVAAERELAEHRYDRAMRLLEQVPAHALAPPSEALLQRARELASLAWDLRNAPVVDQTLSALADRMRRLAPGDEGMAKLRDLLRRRLTENQNSRRPIPWARPPQNTPLGVPVEWLADFRRIKSAETPETADLQRYPGRFAVACGLALAGLGQAAVNINLPPGERGVWDRVARLVRPKTARTAWGIDLGTSSLKAVKLAWDATRQQAVIEAAVLVEHAKPLNHAANEIEEGKLATDTLKAFIGKWPTKGERVCAGMPGRMALCRQFDLPPSDSNKTAKLVEFEARVQLNFPLEQLVWDHHPLGGVPSDQTDAPPAPGTQSDRTLLVAAKRHSAERFLEAFRRTGLRVDVLQPDFIALHNLLVYDCLTGGGETAPSPPCPVAAGLDIGCCTTHIVVSSPRSFWFHGCGVAGESFTRALVKEFKLSVAQAEELKRSVESAESIGGVYRALTPLFDDLLRETQDLLADYSRSAADYPIQQIFGLGGGFALHGLFRYLRCGR